MARIIANGKVKDNWYGLSGYKRIIIEGEKDVTKIICSDNVFSAAVKVLITEGSALPEECLPAASTGPHPKRTIQYAEQLMGYLFGGENIEIEGDIVSSYPDKCVF